MFLVIYEGGQQIQEEDRKYSSVDDFQQVSLWVYPTLTSNKKGTST